MTEISKISVGETTEPDSGVSLVSIKDILTAEKSKPNQSKKRASRKQFRGRKKKIATSRSDAVEFRSVRQTSSVKTVLQDPMLAGPDYAAGLAALEDAQNAYYLLVENVQAAVKALELRMASYHQIQEELCGPTKMAEVLSDDTEDYFVFRKA